MSSRDEQLEALEAAVKSAESKLKTAKMSVDDIDRKIKSVDEAFEQKLAEKAIGYKEQTGADFSREVDVNGRVSYSFSREAKPKERRTLTIKRQFDSETGKVGYKVGFTDNGNQTVSVNSAKDLKKPSSRKKYIAFNLFGYRKLELSTEVNNPFLNTVGKPIIVPIQAAAKLVDKTEEFAKKVSESSVGRGIADAAKIVSAPIVIPAKIVKDISDKGGVIHSISDLGDKIKIEGVNVPKPLKTVASGTVSVAKGMETLAVNTAKSVNKFTIEIAKEKLYEEIHKGISENESTQAAYVIGVRAIDVYKVLNEHTKYKKAVRRDKAGNDITDTNVSRYLAGKEESKYQRTKDSLNEEKKAADYSAYNARKEYEAAKARLESYKRSKGIPVSEVQTDEIIYEKPKLTKTEKDIEKTKRKLKSVQNHKYRFKRQKVFIPQKGKVVSKVMLTRVDVTEPTPMTAWETRKGLEGLAVRDVGMSMRRKAMRDGGDNSGVEAANFAITASQSATRLIKAIDKKERDLTERHYEKKLHKLENIKGIENAVESVKPYDKGFVLKGDTEKIKDCILVSYGEISPESMYLSIKNDKFNVSEIETNEPEKTFEHENKTTISTEIVDEEKNMSRQMSLFDDISDIEDFPNFIEEESIVSSIPEPSAITDFRAKTEENFKFYNFKPLEIENMVKDFVQKVFEENGVNADIHGAAVTGSRSRGLENADSDIDVVIEVDSDLKEDVLFNIIHDEEFTLSGCTIDINPIKADETGTLETYLPRAEAYLTEKAQNNKHTDLDVAKQLITDYLDSEFGEPSDFSDISKISLAYTTDEEHDLPIQVYADLEQFRLIYEYDGNVVRNEQYNSLAEMNKNALSVLDFSDLVSLSDDEILSVIQAKSDEPLHSESEIKAPEKPQKFTITDYTLGEGGAKTKFKNNLLAIETLKQIENEDRRATPEEQEILSKYVGWGGLQEAFDEREASWRKEFNELKSLLTEEEYEAARSTVNDAFYTSPIITQAIYEGLSNIGFKGGEILDEAVA